MPEPSTKTLVLGTRGSELAITQCEQVRAALLARADDLEVELLRIVTTGDKNQKVDEPIARDKADWVREIEQELSRGSISAAIHSGKDVPIDLHPDTELLPVLPRGNPFDVLVFRKNKLSESREGVRLLDRLAQGALVGTSSLRRAAQLRYRRPDLQIVAHRGNVPTRLRKLHESQELDAIVLAAAGLDRLELLDEEHCVFSKEDLLPAVNQGILVAQFRAEDDQVRGRLQQLVDPLTVAAWRAERAVVRVLQADCSSAVSVFAEEVDSKLRVAAEVYATDGSTRILIEEIGGLEGASELGLRVGEELLANGAAELL